MLGSKSRFNKVTLISFSSKIFTFSLVGLTGFVLNYVVSHILVDGTLANLWYIHATMIGIAISTTSNFILNKIFTFKDTNFRRKYLGKQYLLYVLFTLFGSAIQLAVIWGLVEFGTSYSQALLVGVIIGAFSNFLLNKKWTFQQKIWH